MTDRDVWWHRTDGVSLGFGVFFVGLAGLWLLSRLVTLDVVMVGWIAAGGLVLAGVAGIVGALLGLSRRHAEDQPR